MAVVVASLLFATEAPAALAPFNLQSSTHPSADAWYASRAVSLSWEGPPEVTLAGHFGWRGPIYVTDIQLDAGSAYLTTTFGGLRIMDVGDPASAPVQVAAYDAQSDLGLSPHGLTCVALHGDYVFVGCDGGRTLDGFEAAWLQMIDFSDSSAPEPAGYISWDWPDAQVCSALVAGDRLYVLVTGTEEGDESASAFLETYRFTENGLLEFTGICRIGWRGPAYFYDIYDNPWKRDMVLRSGLLYIGGWELHIVDVSDPASPELVGATYDPQDGSCCMGVALSGSWAFAGDDPDAAREGDLDVYDVTHPADPQYVTSFSWKQANGNFPMEMVREVVATDDDAGLSKHYLFAGWNNSPWDASYVNLLDVTDPTNPVDLGSIEVPDDLTTTIGPLFWRATDLVMGGDWLYGSARDADYEFVTWHVGPTDYSYLLDQDPNGVPDTAADGGHGLAGSATVTAPTEGVYYFHVRCRDAGGAWGATLTRRIKIDGTAPTVTTNADGKTHPVFTLLLTASDGSGSGVATVHYRVDGGAWRTGTSVCLKCYGKRTTTRPGTHTVEYRATDLAGNVGQIGSCQVSLGR